MGAALILGALVHFMLRSRADVRGTVADPGSAELPADRPARDPRAVWTRTSAVASPVRPLPAVAASPALVVEVATPATAEPTVIPPRRSAAAMEVLRRYRLTQQADEMALESLRIAEADRAAIRKINEEHRPPRSNVIPSVADGGAENPDRREANRRVAIEKVLGDTAAKEFFAAEASERSARDNQLQQLLGASEAASPPGVTDAGPSGPPPTAAPPVVPPPDAIDASAQTDRPTLLAPADDHVSPLPER